MIDVNKDLSGLPDPVDDAQFYDGVAFKRFMAWVIDFVIVLAVAMGGVVATLGLLGFAFPILLFAINLVYRLYFISQKSATLGMSVVGIELRNHRGERLNFDETLWHTGTFILIFMFFFTNLISVIMVLTTARHQALHDYLLGTTAINRPAD